MSLPKEQCSKCHKHVVKMLSDQHKLPTNEKFEPWKSKQCPDCRKEYEREKSRRAYLKKKRKDNTPRLLSCKMCDIKLDGNKQLFCSRSCQQKDVRLRKEGLQKNEGKCGRCKVIYTKRDPSERICSKCKHITTLKKAAKLEEQRNKEKIKEANIQAKETEKHARYAKLLKKQEARLIKLKLRKKNCQTCSSEMSPRKQKYCSKKCIPRSPAKNAARKLRKRACRQRKLSCVSWSQIADYYSKCPENHDVDHVIPLNGKLVSGLHVPWNFQYLTKADNNKKLASFDGTYDNEGWRF